MCECVNWDVRICPGLFLSFRLLTMSLPSTMEVPDLNKIGEILLEKCFVCISFFDIFIAALSINLNQSSSGWEGYTLNFK